MQAMQFRQSNFAQTAVVSVLGLGALMLLGVVLAYWTWTWLGPRPEPRVETSAEPTGGMAAASALFGRVQRGEGADAPPGSAIRLLGVVAAAGGRPGYAVMRLDAKQSLAVRSGEDLAPGIRLEKVFPDHVILRRNGVSETLAWPERGKSTSPLAPGIGK